MYNKVEVITNNLAQECKNKEVEKMKPILEEMKAALRQKNIHLSHQRLKILEYLIQGDLHPTAEKIYADLRPELSTLSKTTVYNTLKLMEEEGLIRALTIEDNEIRYDIILEDHGHFKCPSCGRIYNFSIDTDSLYSEDLEGFDIQVRNVYFIGVCPRCLAKGKMEETKQKQ